jgi:hypothetical protein
MQNLMYKSSETKILPIPGQYILSLMNFIINNEENFHTVLSTTMLIQGIRTIFIYQIPTHLVFKKSTFYAGIKIFNSLPSSQTILKNDKAKFKATLRKHFNAQFFSSVDKFVMCKMAYILFCKMFVVFYTVKIVYICVFMTCSTS